MIARRIALGLVAATVLAVGLLVGLSSGTASAGHTTTTSTTTTTVATIPEPVVTTVAQPTVTTQTLPGTGRPTVLLADLANPEQFIIGQLYDLALEQQGYKVELISRNAGPPAVRSAALKDGNLDLYPEYLGTWNSSIAHLHRRFRSLKASYAAANRYARKHGFVLLPPTPFSDTSCVAVLMQYARANHVYSLPELARGGPIIFGAPLNFQLEADGIPALEHSYHLKLDYVTNIGDGLQDWWLRSGNVDAAYCATTDPGLDGPEYLALRDQKAIFGHGNVVPATTKRFVRHEGRAFVRTIERVDRLLTLQAVRGLNEEYEMGGHSPTEIAKQFLEGNGLLPPARYAPVPTTTTTTPSSTGS